MVTLKKLALAGLSVFSAPVSLDAKEIDLTMRKKLEHLLEEYNKAYEREHVCFMSLEPSTQDSFMVKFDLIRLEVFREVLSGLLKKGSYEDSDLCIWSIEALVDKKLVPFVLNHKDKISGYGFTGCGLSAVNVLMAERLSNKMYLALKDQPTLIQRIGKSAVNLKNSFVRLPGELKKHLYYLYITNPVLFGFCVASCIRIPFDIYMYGGLDGYKDELAREFSALFRGDFKAAFLDKEMLLKTPGGFVYRYFNPA